jgi:hypothetical protein
MVQFSHTGSRGLISAQTNITDQSHPARETIMQMTALGLAACLAAGLTGTCWAQDLKATQRLSGTQLGFDLGGSYGNYTLTIAGPNGFHASASSKTGTPSIDLRRIGSYDDGIYTYQLTGSTDEKVPVRGALDNGRAGGPTESMFKGVSTSGHFEVKGGTIVKYDPAVTEPQRQK